MSNVQMTSAALMPINKIIEFLKTDAISYSESLEHIKENPNYFSEDDNYQHKYWTDWFNGHDVNQY